MAFEGPGPDPSSGFPPFQLDLGLGQRVSGRLGSVTESTIHLVDGPGGRPIALPRDAAQALLQRAGEAQVFRDGFEAIESGRWARIGDPEIVDEPRTEGEHSLRVPAGGTSLTCRIARAGRIRATGNRVSRHPGRGARISNASST